MNGETFTLTQIAIAILVLVNIVSFLMVAYDKRKAIGGRHGHRMPEGAMFFMATMFSSVGVYLGMWLCRHKVRKWYFQVGLPLVLLQNLATLYVVWQLFVN